MSQLIAKMTDKPEKWPWVYMSAIEAHNSKIHAPTSQGATGFSPNEILYGISPVLWKQNQQNTRMQLDTISNKAERNKAEVIAEAKNRILEFVQESRDKYNKQLDKAISNATKPIRRFQVGDIVRKVTQIKKQTDKKPKKLASTFSEKQVVIKVEGYGSYLVQRFGDPEAEVTVEHVDDLKSETTTATREEKKQAIQQAEETAEALIEWEVNEIIAERGSLAKKTKEYLVRYEGYPEPLWQPAHCIDDNLEALVQFKSKKKKKLIATVAAGSTLRTIETMSEEEIQTLIKPQSTTLKMDVTECTAETLIENIMREAGYDMEQLLHVNIAIPCETFSQTGHTNKNRKVRDPIATGSNHGSNYRKSDEFRSPCCPMGSTCKYAEKAREHDKIAQEMKRVAELLHKNETGKVTWAIENPVGDLHRRDYMRQSEWRCPVARSQAHMCAFQHPAKTPKHIWTNMLELKFRGTTGNGLCNNGECGQGYMSDKNRWSHHRKIGRNPNDGPRGKGAKKMKNHIPEEFNREILIHALKTNNDPYRNVVIDVFAGWQSLKPVCEELGLHYIAVDIKGDRNEQTSKK